MDSKTILLTLSETPFGADPILEYLRTALGITAGYREHRISILFTGDSVYVLNIFKDDPELDKFIKTLSMLDARLYLDGSSLEDRGIKAESVKEPFRTAEDEEISRLYRESNINISL